MKTKIALTCGCACGIGPEIARSAAKKLSGRFEITLYGQPDAARAGDGGKCGRLSFAAVEAALAAVVALREDALVTCPINKAHWHESGVPFAGHTEYLAGACNAADYAMMMASPRLKVTLATIHCAVKEIPRLLTKEKIVTAARLTRDALVAYFGIPHPRVAIAGLNPHCGDAGLFGDEEARIIKPAIDEITRMDINATGPYAADTVFARALSNEFDAVIAMYHDQGLAAIKTLDFANTVNVTLGLPVIRTSVDHGTAEDVAGRGIADDGNLIAAIEMAAQMVKRRQRTEDRGQRTEDRGQRTEDRRQRTEDRRQRTEDRRQRTENRRQ